MSLVFPIEPMRAVSGVLPPADEDDRWAYEIKWDGMRVVAFVAADGTVRLQSARPREITATFPELASLAEATAGREAVLDGEVVALDERGRPSFTKLQQRMHLADAREAARRAAEVPIGFQVFDLLSFDGHDAVRLPYLQRRRLLAEVVTPGPHWAVPAHHVGGGAALFEQVAALGLEGIMAKRCDSAYLPGRRSPLWRKIKVRAHQEFVVGGWTPGAGRRADALGALLIGLPDGSGGLRYTGRVGTGFSDDELARLATVLAPLRRPSTPFSTPVDDAGRRPAGPAPAGRPVWVEPVLVVEVAYAEWTPDGVLRHPAYLGRRDDKDAADVRDERLAE